jgi:DNA-binding transcriptional MerR regulator
VQDRRHHVPAARLLGPHRSAAPVHLRGAGERHPAALSYTDLLELKVIKQLLDAGVSLQSARRAIECLRTNVGGDLASANLVLNGASSVLAWSDGEVVDLLKGGQGVLNMVLPLAGVVEQLDAAITEFATTQAPTESAAGHSRAAGGGG